MKNARAGFSEVGKGRVAEAHASQENVIMSHSCDNPNCSNTVDCARGDHARCANSTFCSSRCKKEFFLWVVAIAHCKTEASVAPRLGTSRI
jgi:hypothetical protein